MRHTLSYLKTKTIRRRSNMNNILHGYIVHTGQLDEAERLVKQYHYSRRMPAVNKLIVTLHEPGGLFGDMGEAVAAVIYSLTQGGGWKRNDVWELTRLVRRDDLKFPLSALISWSLRYIKKHHSAECKLIVSYADSKHKHHGGIYQATNFYYHGKTRAGDVEGYVNKDGVFIPRRTISSKSQLSEYRRRYGTLYAVRDAGKYLYWLPISEEGAKLARALKLRKQPYPKPDLEATWKKIVDN